MRCFLVAFALQKALKRSKNKIEFDIFLGDFSGICFWDADGVGFICILGAVWVALFFLKVRKSSAYKLVGHNYEKNQN